MFTQQKNTSFLLSILRSPKKSTLFPYTTLFRSYDGTGPLLIENNELQASSENIMFGGSDSSRPDLVPADIVIRLDRKSTRLNSSHMSISYAVFCLKKKKNNNRFTFSHRSQDKTI